LRHSNFIVRDHHVHDVRTLPGVTLLDMIYRLSADYIGSRAVELRRIVFKQPIVTSERFDKQIFVKFVPLESHWQISISSQGTKGGRAVDEKVHQNMECTLFPLVEQGPPRKFDVRKFIAEADYRVDMDSIYLLAQRAGIKHFSFMKTLGSVYCRKSSELMALQLGDEAEQFRENFYSHPALLDGSTFAGQSIRVRNESEGIQNDDTPYIPFTIDRFCVHKPLPRKVYTYSENAAYWSRQEKPDSDVKSVDVTIFDENGELLAEIKKFTMKRIRAAHLIKNLINDAQDVASSKPTESRAQSERSPAAVSDIGRAEAVALQHMPVTIEAYIRNKISNALDRSPDELSIIDNFYDLGMDSTQLLWLTKELEGMIGKELYPTLLFEYSNIQGLADYLKREFAVDTVMPPTPQGSATPDIVKRESAALQDELSHEIGETLLFERVWKPQSLVMADAAVGVSKRFVVFAGNPFDSYDAIEHPGVDTVMRMESDGLDVAQQMEDMLSQLVGSMQKIIAQLQGADVLLQLVVKSREHDRWASTFAGSLRTLCIEHPRIRCQVISVDDLRSQSIDAMASILRMEAAVSLKGVAEIIYENGLQTRLVSVLHEVSYAPLTKAITSFRENGVYVITGGLGGLGLIVAEHIASQVACKLVLMGRSQLDEAGRRKIDRLRGRGAEVLYFATDLGDYEMLAAALKSIRETFGSVNGILHSAGVIKDQTISRKNLEDVRSVLRPKVTGLWNLDRVTAEDELDFFLVFSSLSALTGNIGQVDYSGANAFMDSFAAFRRGLVAGGLRCGETVSVNWPLWAEGAMAIDKEVARRLYLSSGLQPLPTATGLEIMDWALRQRKPQLAVAYGVRDKIKHHIHSLTSTLRGQDASDVREPPKSTNASAFGGAAELQTRAAVASADLAVIGVAGRYPKAGNIDEFYRNLRDGRDCISGFPADRWQDYDFSFSVDEYYKFGGFLGRIDEFDPLFFGFPPVKAQFLDPQARLFLETVWEACEDAGFYQDRTQQNYRSGKQNSVGVFVGAFWSHYELFGSEYTQRGTPMSMGVSLSSISNITSYCMNFHGPSVALDTMCSSALTAIHMACESIRRNECQFAIAGGVNLVTHPHKFIFLRENHFLSSDGACRSFGENGDGYVPGEGVGALLLTTLERAETLGYPIHAVIKGSAINHSGRTAGATVPNPMAQSEVIRDALVSAQVDPRTISYVEAHGTGTSLGDPIEVQGLTKAFGHWTHDRQFCAIGSSKSNIGHLEAAAGIAGLTKLLLQFKHGEIFPSLHAEKLNPLIAFEKTPFYVERNFRKWDRPEVEIRGRKTSYPRRALISSFGASGSNASLVVEEYIRADRVVHANRPAGSSVAIILSGRDQHRLSEQVRRLLSAIKEGALTDEDLGNIAYTLQVGREPMDERIAVEVKSLHDLERKLELSLSGVASIENLYRGRVKRNNPVGKMYSSDPELRKAVDSWLAAERYVTLLSVWVEGVIVDWSRLYGAGDSRRIPLPTYPFARDRYWVPKPAESLTQTAATAERIVILAETREKSVAPVIVSAVTPPTSAGIVAEIKSQISLRNPGASRPVPAREPETKKISLTSLAARGAATTLPLTTSQLDIAPAEKPHRTETLSDLASIQAVLARTLAKVLFLDADQIEADAPFTDLGLDSIIGVQWIRAINQEFSSVLKATALYEHSSIRAMAAYVQMEISGEATPTNTANSDEKTGGEPAQRSFSPTVSAPAGEGDDANTVSFAAIKDTLIGSLAKVLFMDAAEIDAAASFADYGLDSIIAVQWIKAVNAHFGTSLKATALYEQSSITTLAQHLQTSRNSNPDVGQSGSAQNIALPRPLRRTVPADASFEETSNDTSLVDVEVEENYRYVLAGCEGVQVSLIRSLSGLQVEVFSVGFGRPVVLLPPMGSLATIWMHQIRVLSKKYRLIIVHYPGHGRSTYSDAQGTFAGTADLVMEVLDTLGIDQLPHLVGWSMGALIAEKIALQSPDKIRSITIISAPAKVDSDSSADVGPVLDGFVADYELNVPDQAITTGAREARYEFIKATRSLDVAMSYLRETLNFDYGSTARISSETLVIVGARDRVIPREHGEMILKAIANARYFELEEGGHYIPLQNHEWFNARLTEFLSELDEAGEPADAELKFDDVQ